MSNNPWNNVIVHYLTINQLMRQVNVLTIMLSYWVDKSTNASPS